MISKSTMERILDDVGNAFKRPLTPSDVSKHESQINALADYLCSISERGLIGCSMADTAWAAWEEIYAAFVNSIQVPNACPGPDGGLLMMWDSGGHRMELEFTPGEVPEVFYWNKRTGDGWHEDINTSGSDHNAQ